MSIDGPPIRVTTDGRVIRSRVAEVASSRVVRDLTSLTLMVGVFTAWVLLGWSFDWRLGVAVLLSPIFAAGIALGMSR